MWTKIKEILDEKWFAPVLIVTVVIIIAVIAVISVTVRGGADTKISDVKAIVSMRTV